MMGTWWLTCLLIMTLALCHTCLGNSTALFNTTETSTTTETLATNGSTTEFSPTTTYYSTVTPNLEDEKMKNMVTVKFYKLSLSKFNERAYSGLLAEKVTEHCNETYCGLQDRVTFTSSHVINTDLRQSSRDLELSTLVLYTNQSSNLTWNLVLPKVTLTEILTNNRDDFRELLGSDIIGVDSSTFHIKADVTNNAIISIAFVLLTLVLLVAVLIIRKSHNEEQRKEYAKIVIDEKRRQRESEQTYKIRPGPEPVDKPHPTKLASIKRKPGKINPTTNGKTISPQTSILQGAATLRLTSDAESGRTNGYSRMNSNVVQPMGINQVTSEDDFSSAARLPPLGDQIYQEKKKKKKDKKRKRKAREAKEEEETSEHE